MPALILFFIERNREAHYGSYEAQILIHCDLGGGYYSRQDRFLALQSLVEKVLRRDMDIDTLRFLYVAETRTIHVNRMGTYTLRYHHLLNEAALDMQNVKQDRFF